MPSSWFSVAALLGLAIQAQAGRNPATTANPANNAVRPSISTRFVTICSTALGPSSLAVVPTIQNTVYQSFPVTRRPTTTTLIVTVTPAAAVAIKAVDTTSIVTITPSTSAGTSTVFQFTTKTKTKTTITTVCASTTAIITTTVPPATVTVAPSPGFIPLASGIASHKTLVKRDGSAKFTQAVLANGAMSPQQFPQGILCNTVVQVITTVRRTSTRSSTVFAATPTTTSTTVTSIATITQTAVLAPTATTTQKWTTKVHTTVTKSVVTTSTISTTTTITAAGTAPTFYAACAPNNIIGNVDGKGIKAVKLARSPAAKPATDAYSCCVACLNSPNCAFAQFFPASSGQPNNCFHARKANKGDHDPTYEGGEFYVSRDTLPDLSFLSNSNDGQVVFAGDFNSASTTTLATTTTTATGATGTPTTTTTFAVVASSSAAAAAANQTPTTTTTAVVVAQSSSAAAAANQTPVTTTTTPVVISTSAAAAAPAQPTTTTTTTAAAQSSTAPGYPHRPGKGRPGRGHPGNWNN